MVHGMMEASTDKPIKKRRMAGMLPTAN